MRTLPHVSAVLCSCAFIACVLPVHTLPALGQSLQPRREHQAQQQTNKQSASGMWVWTTRERNGRTRDYRLTLMQEGEKVTGTLVVLNNEVLQVRDGKFKDGEISFVVVQQFPDRQIITTYSGRVDGELIKGSFETDNNGRVRWRDWAAVRVKEPL
jgi:hypothetical protein